MIGELFQRASRLRLPFPVKDTVFVTNGSIISYDASVRPGCKPIVVWNRAALSKHMVLCLRRAYSSMKRQSKEMGSE